MEMVQFCVNQEEKKKKQTLRRKKMGSIIGQFSVYWHSHELKAGAMRTKPPSAPEGPNVLPPHCQYMVWPRRFFFFTGFKVKDRAILALGRELTEKPPVCRSMTLPVLVARVPAAPPQGGLYLQPPFSVFQLTLGNCEVRKAVVWFPSPVNKEAERTLCSLPIGSTWR